MQPVVPENDIRSLETCVLFVFLIHEVSKNRIVYQKKTLPKDALHKMVVEYDSDEKNSVDQ